MAILLISDSLHEIFSLSGSLQMKRVPEIALSWFLLLEQDYQLPASYECAVILKLYHISIKTKTPISGVFYKYTCLSSCRVPLTGQFFRRKILQLAVKTFSEGIVLNERFEAEKLVFAESEIFCREPSNNFRWKIITSHLMEYPNVYPPIALISASYCFAMLSTELP